MLKPEGTGPFRFCTLLVLSLVLLGCGPRGVETAIVKGKVTYKNKPVPNGTVNFTPIKMGPTATGQIQPDGSYTLTTTKAGDGAVIGTHSVVIVAMQDNANALPEQRSPTPPPIVPMKYTSPATSDLKATVEQKENTIDFDLKD
jgi:hypothetical protein